MNEEQRIEALQSKWLDLRDRYHELMDWDTKKGSAPQPTQELRNLSRLRYHYMGYAEQVVKRGQPAPGIPIALVDETFTRLKDISFMTRTFDRDWFVDQSSKGRGTHTEYLEPEGEQGYQWWYVTWMFQDGTELALKATHWLIDRDDEDQRVTIWMTNGYMFTEPKSIVEYDQCESLIRGMTMRDIPDTHKRQVIPTAKHLLRADEGKDYALVISKMTPYGMMQHIGGLYKNFDINSSWHNQYLDQRFKQHWGMLMLDLIFGKDTPERKQWGSRHITDAGILRDLWYLPDFTKPEVPQMMAKYEQDYKEAVEEYNKWKWYISMSWQGRKNQVERPDMTKVVMPIHERDTEDQDT